MKINCPGNSFLINAADVTDTYHEVCSSVNELKVNNYIRTTILLCTVKFSPRIVCAEMENN